MNARTSTRKRNGHRHRRNGRSIMNTVKNIGKNTRALLSKTVQNLRSALKSTDKILAKYK
jgi:hypothetical protein